MGKNIVNYEPTVLVRMAQEYLNAAQEFEAFVASKKFPGCDFVTLKTEEDNRLYWVKEKESSCKWDALRDACELVSADVDIVLLTAKAMNRFEKKMRWQVCAHLPFGWCSECCEHGETRVRRFFAVSSTDETCFQSSGRFHPWGWKADTTELYWLAECERLKKLRQRKAG